MNVEEIRKRLDKLCNESDDVAHKLLDELYVDVLRSIANRITDAPALAKAVLKGEEMVFSRRCC